MEERYRPMVDVTELFDGLADRYDRSAGYFAAFAGPLVELAEPAPNGIVVDVAAGTGAVTGALSHRLGENTRVLAVDRSIPMLRRLRRRRLPRTQVALMDARRLALPDRSIALVTAGFLLHFVTDAGEMLREARRVLAPGGVLLASTPGPCDDGGWWQHYGEVLAPYAAQVSQRRPTDMNDWAHDIGALAAAAGLVDVDRHAAEVHLPMRGPEHYREWLMSMGNRWIDDALAPAAAAALRDDIIASLRTHHPAGGHRLDAGATLWRMRAPR